MLEKIKKIRKWGVDGGYDFDIEARDLSPLPSYMYRCIGTPHSTSPNP